MELTTQEGRRQVIQAIIESHRANGEANVIVGIAGTVASGKTRFTRALIGDLAKMPSRRVVHLPLEQWINRPAFVTGVYADRFYLDELRAALIAIRGGQHWLCPRFDLIKLFKREPMRQPTSLTFEAAEVEWNHKRYRRIAAGTGLPDLPGAAGVYADADSERLFSLFLPQCGVTYLVDGTMVYAADGTGSIYDHRVYVCAPWAVRVARLLRRYNRGEVFGATAKSEAEYVRFLTDEAAQCADAAIGEQASIATHVVRSSSETLSNILDLHYLNQGLVRSGYGIAFRVGESEIQGALSDELHSLASVTDPDIRSTLRAEFDGLIESKHLLVIERVDRVLDQFYQVLFQRTEPPR